ncbi:uncharacterized protein LOC127264172 [Andrographis paniculata]|uniref:uncharacterized protein LOC127264172 n=1 Tax=Andrographis paniculata TaxID=175694 RepID=UPI0021E77B55|nr:uncharacterized protein LOC127264172 [Andrographis paniculata]
MADLFLKQSKQYSEGRPDYPDQLFHFISSHTPSHDLAWDVGTGTGQAAKSLAKAYKNVIATDTSPKQLEYAEKLSNITYQCTPQTMSISDIHNCIGSESTFDLITIAQAMHWFHLPTFYNHVNHLLKKPAGAIAAWCYTLPEVNPAVDKLLNRFYNNDVGPYWESARTLVDEKYKTIDFPFDPVDGLESNGPFRFNSEKVMDLDKYIVYLKSWSAYHTAKGKGVELLTENLIQDFKKAWDGEDGQTQKIVVFPIYLRFGKVGSAN